MVFSFFKSDKNKEDSCAKYIECMIKDAVLKYGMKDTISALIAAEVVMIAAHPASEDYLEFYLSTITDNVKLYRSKMEEDNKKK